MKDIRQLIGTCDLTPSPSTIDGLLEINLELLARIERLERGTPNPDWHSVGLASDIKAKCFYCSDVWPMNQMVVVSGQLSCQKCAYPTISADRLPELKPITTELKRVPGFGDPDDSLAGGSCT